MNFLPYVSFLFAASVQEETPRERINRVVGMCINKLGNATGYVILKAYKLKKMAEEEYQKYFKNEKKKIVLQEENLESKDAEEFLEKLDETIQEISKKIADDENVAFDENKVLEEEAEHLQQNKNKEENSTSNDKGL
ncbi:hypothetical protein EHP00_1061 [Ecytonucleospora hepatopenaei]|uniref:Uncharacterized protein n=1 Tax=Ecytonucleospora hepatopenaei TaxID=646526 RepID=A0A1W0E5F5_9MICR|nr:hypothetical protein EHP00_1061 [Ecytonucleospora hepatopenaei]